jgi:hypothetical protein
MNIEHFSFLSWFSAGPESHEQDGKTLSRAATRARCEQRLAILPWRSEPCLGARAHHYRLLPVAGGAIAAGSNERTRILKRIRFTNTRRFQACRAITNYRRMPSVSIKDL